MREPSIRETAFSCPHCGAYTTQHWYTAYPQYLGRNETPTIPSKDFEEKIRSRKDINEAAALLRLAIQMLCKHLGESGKNLNNDIANLVKKGLNPIVQQSLDIVRVIGNQSVHPGVIDLNDDKDTAIRLFDLINIIAEQMITQPKHVRELYEKLPESKRAEIQKRDSKSLESK